MEKAQREQESKWLPIPEDPLAWINGDVRDLDAKEANTRTVMWLKHVLDAASDTGSSRLKDAAQQLLAVQYFTRNLQYMRLFDGLQAHCRSTLLRYCQPLQAYYTEQKLGDFFRTVAIPMHPGLDGKSHVRQDHALIGLELSDETIQDPHTRESVYIHFLRLVAMAVNEDFQKKCAEIAERWHGKLKSCNIKGDVRIRNKAVADHRDEPRPRPALNIDVVRNAITFQTKEDLAPAAVALSESMGGALRVKNGTWI